MKQMKYSCLLPASLCTGLITGAQPMEYKVSVADMKEAKLILEDFTDDVAIEGYAGSEIIVSGGVHFANDRAKGLKAVYAGGTDNTGLAVYMEKNGNRITLRCLLFFKQKTAYEIKVPE